MRQYCRCCARKYSDYNHKNQTFAKKGSTHTITTMSFRTMFSRLQSRRVYLDHASAPIPDRRVLDSMHRLEHVFGNPSAAHAEGRAAKELLASARAAIGSLLAVKKDEIIFTSGGTESNNIALRGLVRGLHRAGTAYADMHLITGAIEHPSVAEVINECRSLGVSVTVLPVNADGHISIPDAVNAVNGKSTIVTLAYVNGEIGVVEPIRKIVTALRDKKREIGGSIYIHTDASQAGMYLDLTAHTLGVDLMTLDALKLRGPKGSGALFAKLMTPLAPITFGGGQERGVRPGTESLVLAHGLAEALRHAVSERRVRAQNVEALRDYALNAIEREFPQVVVNGDRKNRCPNNIHISFPGVDGEYLATLLDTHGIACSTRSACLGADGTGSSVVRELGKSESLALGAIRLTLGEETRKGDMDHLVRALKKSIPVATKS